MLNDLKQKKIFKEPIFYILLFCFILFVIGINWGLPSTGTWQSDSFAPDVPVQGLVRGFSFGYYTKYPLVHQIVLSIFNIPVLIFAFIKSLSLNGFDKELLKELIFHDIRYLTTFTIIDRFVSLIMGLFIVYLIYLSGKELFNKRVGVFSAIIVSLNPVLNHYSHVAKVEVSYIFWAMLALYTLIRVVKFSLQDIGRNIWLSLVTIIVLIPVIALFSPLQSNLVILSKFEKVYRSVGTWWNTNSNSVEVGSNSSEHH